jgi:hypothetical protein
MIKNNLTSGYVLFVGIPLLILIGVLRAGSGLSAPPAVSGEWTVEPTTNKCAGPAAVTISQTGADLIVTFNDPPKTTLAGRLESGQISAVSSTAGACRPLHLEAAIVGKPGRRSLEGRLSFDGCNTCAPVPFRAVKSGK